MTDAWHSVLALANTIMIRCWALALQDAGSLQVLTRRQARKAAKSNAMAIRHRDSRWTLHPATH
jgi:hypothetical protein